MADFIKLVRYNQKELAEMSEEQRGSYFSRLREASNCVKEQEELCVSVASKGDIFSGFTFCAGRESLVWSNTKKAYALVEKLSSDISRVVSLNSPRKVLTVVGEQHEKVIQPYVERKVGSPYLRAHTE